jgi:UDP-glucose 6-dehydrogenase
VETFTDAYSAAKGSHALCVLTEWDEFKELDFKRIYADMVRGLRISCWAVGSWGQQAGTAVRW